VYYLYKLHEKQIKYIKRAEMSRCQETNALFFRKIIKKNKRIIFLKIILYLNFFFSQKLVVKIQIIVMN